jgi:hypothetical protein
MTSHDCCRIAQIAKFPIKYRNLILWRRIAVGTEVQSLAYPFCQYPYLYFLKEFRNFNKEVRRKRHFSFHSRMQFFRTVLQAVWGFLLTFLWVVLFEMKISI